MKSSKVFWGIFFILAAVYVIVSEFGIFPDIGIFRIVLTIWLIWLCVEGIRMQNFYEIFLPLAGIYVLYRDWFFFVQLSAWSVFGAAILVSIGLSLLFDRSKKKRYIQGAGGFGDGAQQCTGEQIRVENNFGTAIRYVNSDNFKNADVENNFGTLSLYLDNAVVQGGSAFINVDNSFGTTNLYVPKEWKTQNNFKHSFGTINEIGSSLGTSMTVFYMNGEANFGSINVHYI